MFGTRQLGPQGMPHFIAAAQNRAPSLSWASLYFLLVILDTFLKLLNSWRVFKMHVTSKEGMVFPAAGSAFC